MILSPSCPWQWCFHPSQLAVPGTVIYHNKDVANILSNKSMTGLCKLCLWIHLIYNWEGNVAVTICFLILSKWLSSVYFKQRSLYLQETVISTAIYLISFGKLVLDPTDLHSRSWTESALLILNIADFLAFLARKPGDDLEHLICPRAHHGCPHWIKNPSCQRPPLAKTSWHILICDDLICIFLQLISHTLNPFSWGCMQHNRSRTPRKTTLYLVQVHSWRMVWRELARGRWLWFLFAETTEPLFVIKQSKYFFPEFNLIFRDVCHTYDGNGQSPKSVCFLVFFSSEQQQCKIPAYPALWLSGQPKPLLHSFEIQNSKDALSRKAGKEKPAIFLSEN